MHRGHGDDERAFPPAQRHNASPAQWQTVHETHDPHTPPASDEDRDLDLVEAAFCESFATASDPTSFLRLAGVPFEGVDADGRRLVLLRVERQDTTDIGSVTPLLGGGDFRYAPLPAMMASRRFRLSFVYFNGESTRALDLRAAKQLPPLDETISGDTRDRGDESERGRG